MEYLQGQVMFFTEVHVANAAVFYNAEGDGCMEVQRDVKTNLAKEQIDFECLLMR